MPKIEPLGSQKKGEGYYLYPEKVVSNSSKIHFSPTLRTKTVFIWHFCVSTVTTKTQNNNALILIIILYYRYM